MNLDIIDTIPAECNDLQYSLKYINGDPIPGSYMSI